MSQSEDPISSTVSQDPPPDSISQTTIETPVKPKKVIIPLSQRTKQLNNVKHLQYSWVYYYCIQSSVSWEPKKIADFATISEFWSVYNNLVPPSKLPTQYQYMVFKKDILPDTDSPSHIDGYKASLFLSTKQFGIDQIDSIWENTLLALLGEYFEHSDVITGIRLLVRSSTDVTISLWMTTPDEHIVSAIQEQWQSLLAIPDPIKVGRLNPSKPPSANPEEPS